MAVMTLDSRTCYRALRARDARFDGRFFVAVSSTRIYCRPVCTVKPPKRENCRFYPSAALQARPNIGAVAFTIESSDAGACMAAYEYSANGTAMLAVPISR